MSFRIPYTLAALVGVAVAVLAASCGGNGSAASTPATSAPASTASRPSTPPALAQAPGYAWLFGAGKVDVVNPRTAKVVKEITKGLDRAGAWNDGVTSTDGKYVFINENKMNQVFVFDTEKQELAKTIDVGANPVHLYLPNGGNEVWTHSDTEGTYYIIDTASLEVTGRVTAASSHTGHGELLYNEPLGSKYYATNVVEPSVFAIDGKTRTVTRRIEVCKADSGRGGTHGQGFVVTNKMAYFQCTGAVTKTAVVDTSTDTFVKYLDINGSMFTSPGAKYVVIANSDANRLDVIDGTTNPETVTPVAIPNKPGQVAFATVDGKLMAFTPDLKTADVEAIDMQAFKVVKSIPGAPLATPLTADQLLGRNSDIGGGYFYTVVKEQNAMSIIDVKTLTTVGSVQLAGATNVVFAARHS